MWMTETRDKLHTDPKINLGTSPNQTAVKLEKKLNKEQNTCDSQGECTERSGSSEIGMFM